MSLLNNHDALLLDLDGTVWEGGHALPGAVETIDNSGLTAIYVTNNASRSPESVAKMLRNIGLRATSEDVLTSAQAAVMMAQKYLSPGDNVLVLGSESFRELVREAGYRVVDSADCQPKAVMQGHSPQTGWAELSEAALSIRNGARYLASNLDTSLPMERGLMVGNGSMVAAVVSATGVEPESAGKPEPTMFYQAQELAKSSAPLSVGDRLDTDIQGAIAAAMPVLHVLTGVSGPEELMHAEVSRRPTYIARDLREATLSATQLQPSSQGGFSATLEGSEVILRGGEPSATFVQAVRTVMDVAWQCEDSSSLKVRAVGRKVEEIMEQWW
ncbi:HAD-IIA family hydrolase [Corynebacterium poyangense]|uniref:HAD-IIA family hydrolase n=1 Tax=Corynebacterium poyangense TaxID=2684405 RepID=A0A7H0SNP4_9CORY|nr:HAD-IIA family hydrolase [Corynebacterium poyangense]MBZ8177714.1 HAD-IIA family hydrolase [Corynebacterium poyangense]QNQ90169.1 HAD-IIA family hydrolase [Corynebacterium poyangense]